MTRKLAWLLARIKRLRETDPEAVEEIARFLEPEFKRIQEQHDRPAEESE